MATSTALDHTANADVLLSLSLSLSLSHSLSHSLSLSLSLRLSFLFSFSFPFSHSPSLNGASWAACSVLTLGTVLCVAAVNRLSLFRHCRCFLQAAALFRHSRLPCHCRVSAVRKVDSSFTRKSVFFEHGTQKVKSLFFSFLLSLPSFSSDLKET